MPRARSSTPQVRLTLPTPRPTSRAATEQQRRREARLSHVMQRLLHRLPADDVADLLDQVASTLPAQNASTAASNLAQHLAVGRQYTADERRNLEAEAQLRAFQARRALLADSCTAAEAAALLGTSRQTPHDRVRAGRLLAVKDRGQLRFPRWQFDSASPDGVVPGLPAVLAALHAGPLAQASWFVRPNPYLENRTPAQALLAGDVDRVVDAARLVGAAAA